MQHNSYKQIFKATSIFGGVQFVNIIVGIVKSKMIVTLLGASGMGIINLLITALSLITYLTSFGLLTSAVKNVSIANAQGNQYKAGKIVAVVRKLVVFSGLLGVAITLIFSPILSKYTFQSNQYTWQFILLSVTLLIDQLTVGQQILMQGLKKIKQLATSTVFGAITSLILSVPLYYFFKLDGIVPALIINSLCMYFYSWFFSRRIQIIKVIVSIKETFHEGKSILKLGLLISLNGLLSVGFAYLLRIYIAKEAGVAEIGFFSAGFALINTYVGMVFASLANDYYPRLSEVVHDRKQRTNLINQQAEITLIILLPILVVFISFIDWGIIILYAKSFVHITPMVKWAVLGITFKAISWTLSFLFLAKNASKYFFWSEFLASVYIFGINILGYNIDGLRGLGISFFVSYMLYFLQVYFLCNIKYQFTLSKNLIKIFSISFISLTILLFLSFQLDELFFKIFGAICSILAFTYSMRQLNNRMGIFAIISNRLKK